MRRLARIIEGGAGLLLLGTLAVRADLLGVACGVGMACLGWLLHVDEPETDSTP